MCFKAFNSIPILRIEYDFKRRVLKPLLVFILLALVIVNGISANEIKTISFGTVNKEHAMLFKISDAVLTNIFKDMGIKFELNYVPAKRLPYEVDQRRIDGDAHRIYDFNREGKYPNLVRVEESIQTINVSAFTKLTNFKVDGWKNLSHYRIFYLSGIKIIERGLDLSSVPPENRLGVYDIDMAFNLLNNERGEIVIVNSLNGQASLKKLGLQDSGIKMLTPPIVEIKLYPNVLKKLLG